MTGVPGSAPPSTSGGSVSLVAIPSGASVLSQRLREQSRDRRCGDDGDVEDTDVVAHTSTSNDSAWDSGTLRRDRASALCSQRPGPSSITARFTREWSARLPFSSRPPVNPPTSHQGTRTLVRRSAVCWATGRCLPDVSTHLLVNTLDDVARTFGEANRSSRQERGSRERRPARTLVVFTPSSSTFRRMIFPEDGMSSLSEMRSWHP